MGYRVGYRSLFRAKSRPSAVLEYRAIFIAMAAFGCPVLEKFGCHPKIFGGEIQPDRQSGDCARRNSFFSLISVRMAATELHLTGIAEVAAVKVFEGEEKKPASGRGRGRTVKKRAVPFERYPN